MNYLIAAMIRGAGPFVIMSGLSLIMKSQKIDPTQVRGTFILGLIITVVAAASVIYDVKSWTLAKQSIIHFLVMLLTIFPCLIFSDWFPNDSGQDILKIFGIFLVNGFILWSIFYIIFGKILNK